MYVAQIERTVAEAMVRFDPVAAEAERIAALEARRFDVRLNQVTYDGIAAVDGALDLADATLLEEAIAAGAAHLAELGSTETLNVRRSQAVGLIARHALTGQSGLDLASAAGVDLMVYVHLDADPQQPDGLDPVARVEHTGSITATEQVKTWCQQAGSRVTVRPVIDLNENLHTDSYQPTPVQREQAVLINPTCIHPHCGRPARRADLDHLLEFEKGGRTESVNLAPECRGHHRLKTHTDWTVRRTGPTTFEWTSPHGRTYDTDTARTGHRRRAS